MTKLRGASALVLLFVSALLPRATAQVTARPVPEWLRAGVIYEIYPRDFSATGDFRGIEARLDDLRKLSVTILWIMPINPVGQVKKKGSFGSPYAVRDYYAIDPSYGTKEDFKRLVVETHRRGLRVILDVVLNHTAWDSVLMKYPEFYKHDAAGNIIPPVADWADVAGLDYSSARLRVYMIDMLKYWLREFDLDGFRCDVAGMIPVDFWEKARAELEKIKPDVLMVAEANSPELLVRAFDLDYAWPLLGAMSDVIENGSPARNLEETWKRERERFPAGALEMRMSDDHDEKRAIARFGERGALAASALVFTLDGVPMLYNGMEAGDTTESGAPALFEKLPIFWPISERRPEFPRFYAQMIALRKTHPALQQGETVWAGNSDPARILTYFRRAPGETFFIAINLSNRPFAGNANVPVEKFQDETPGVDPAKSRPVSLPALFLDAWEFRILRQKN